MRTNVSLACLPPLHRALPSRHNPVDRDQVLSQASIGGSDKVVEKQTGPTNDIQRKTNLSRRCLIPTKPRHGKAVRKAVSDF